jgi:homoserine kinase type II
MAVYTQVSFDQAHAFFHTLGLGPLTRLQGCAGGIENTNYFATTQQGHYVLTVFERLGFDELPFYLHLMKHL